MHTLKVLVLRRSPRDCRSTEEWAREAFQRAIRALPALRVRPVERRLSHPAWQPAEPELDAHLRFERQWPTAQRTLEDALGEHVQGLLPRDRPLWQALVVEEAGSRKVTIAIKYHHALADGLGSGRMLEVLAGRLEAVAYAPPARLSLGARMTELFALLVVSLRGLWRSMRIAHTAPFSGARQAYNATVTRHREVGLAQLSLDAIRRAKAPVGATVNDVLLTLVARALRKVTPADFSAPLVAAQPVAIGAEPHDRGNALSTMFAAVHVEETSARRCLEKTHASTAAAKQAHAARGLDLVMRWSELTPGGMLRGIWALIARSPRPPANLVISNIPGSREAFELAGAHLESVYLVGPLLPTTGLNVTFWSHAGVVSVCVLSAGGVDAAALASATEDALAELLAVEAASRRAA